MSAEPALTADQVRQMMVATADQRSGHDGAWRVEGPLVRARQSRIFRAHTPLAPWPLAVKVFTTDTPPSMIEQQADVLLRYHEAMSATAPSGLTVPALWAVLPEHRSLVMEWINEPRLDRLLWWAGPRRSKRAALIGAAGQWLRHFHEQSAIQPQPLRSERLHKSLDKALGAGRGAGHRAPDLVFRAAYDVLCRLAPQFAEATVDHVESHGDFLPHNLFHGTGRTVGLDFKPRPPVPFARDIFHFLIQAEVEKPFPTRRKNLDWRGLERRDADAFLAGYGPASHSGDDRLMTFLQLAEVTRRWAKLIRRRGLGHILDGVKASRLRRLAAHGIARLEGDV